MLAAAAAAAVVSCLAAAGPGAAGGANGASAEYDRTGWPDRVVVALITIGSRKETLARYSPLLDFVSARTGVKIEPVVTPGYEEIYAGFAKKTMDVAYMGPISYVELGGVARVEPLVMELAPDGQVGYHALLITAAASGITSVSEARGKVIAMVSEQSTSGFYIPTRFLLQTFGAPPAAVASRVVFAGTHEKVIQGVADREYDIGATDDIDYGRALLEKRCAPGQIKALWTSPAYPAPPWAARAELPATLKQALRAAMLAAGRQPEIRAALGNGGFIEVEDKAYDVVRELHEFLK
jgi:phosphonate transport system substrate-binding protein